MAQMTLLVDKSGRAKLGIEGIKGTSCVDKAKPFEDILGRVLDSEETAEFYEEASTETAFTSGEVKPEDVVYNHDFEG